VRREGSDEETLLREEKVRTNQPPTLQVRREGSDEETLLREEKARTNQPPRDQPSPRD